jgi:hypothetical protein
MRWLLVVGLILISGCSRVAGLLPGSSATAGAVATPDLSDAERIALARGRASGCRFVHGFADARDAAPDVIGECTENERSDPATGDTLQRTSRGLLVWRKADGLVAFTDGHRTWVRGPDGLMRVRTNQERFAWEAGPAGPNAPSLRVVTPGPPIPTAAPSPAGSTIPASGPPPFKPAAGTPIPTTKPGVSSEPPKPLPQTGTVVPAKP